MEAPIITHILVLLQGVALGMALILAHLSRVVSGCEGNASGVLSHCGAGPASDLPGRGFAGIPSPLAVFESSLCVFALNSCSDTRTHTSRVAGLADHGAGLSLLLGNGTDPHKLQHDVRL